MIPNIFQTGTALSVALLVSLALPATSFSFLISRSEPDCVTAKLVPDQSQVLASPSQRYLPLILGKGEVAGCALTVEATMIALAAVVAHKRSHRRVRQLVRANADRETEREWDEPWGSWGGRLPPCWRGELSRIVEIDSRPRAN